MAFEEKLKWSIIGKGISSILGYGDSMWKYPKVMNVYATTPKAHVAVAESVRKV